MLKLDPTTRHNVLSSGLAIALLTLGGCGPASAPESSPSQPSAPASEVDKVDKVDEVDEVDKVDNALQERCARTVQHVTQLVTKGPAGSSISPQEAAIINTTVQVSIATCADEGLSEAQAECILAVDDGLLLGDAGRCPAIVERKPSWLILPPPRKELMRAPPPSAAGSDEAIAAEE